MLKIKKPNLYGKLDKAEITAFEESNNIFLPLDYKQFLLNTNGGAPLYNVEMHLLEDSVPKVAWFYSFHNGPYIKSIYYAIDMYNNRIPSWYFPIAKDHSSNLFLMSLYKSNIGTIAFWDHENEAEEGEAEQYFDNMTMVAKSFTEFEKMF